MGHSVCAETDIETGDLDPKLKLQLEWRKIKSSQVTGYLFQKISTERLVRGSGSKRRRPISCGQQNTSSQLSQKLNSQKRIQLYLLEMFQPIKLELELAGLSQSG